MARAVHDGDRSLRFSFVLQKAGGEIHPQQELLAMSNLTNVFAALVIASFCVVGSIATSEAFPGEPGRIPQSLQKLMDNPVLQVKKKKNKCIKVFECDYFAPATACSTPPCCKKGHWEKNCDVDKAQAPAGNTAQAPAPEKTEDKPAPSKQYCETYGTPNGADYFKPTCINQHSGQPLCQEVSTAEGSSKYRCCCYYH
jgi:hypothetical protein